MDEDSLYPEQFRDLAGVLTPCTAEAREPVQKLSAAASTKGRPWHPHVFSSGVSPRLGQGADGSTHGLVRDFDESISQVNEP